VSEGVLVAIIGGVVLIIGSAAGVVSALITSRVQAKKNSADVKLTRIKALEDRVDKLESRDRIHQDYILVLREHITAGSPPPPPPWPKYA
jgi:hypothetical protein